jgi:EAL domain-containing protein (putative c-di-GMP-specific phosphodiesterase class I)
MSRILSSSPNSLISDQISGQSLEQLEEMASLICHEIRTPLTSIQGVLKILSYEQFGQLSEEGEKLLNIALNATNRLNRLACVLEQQFETLPTMLSVKDIEHLQLENDLESGLSHREFSLHYQPIISTADNKIIGFEALARWNHPIKGIIPPGIFIPLMEKSGLVNQLGLSLLDQACQRLSDWQREFPSNSPLTMSINLSSVQLSDPNLSQKIREILNKTRIPPETLKLEVTESALIGSRERALENIMDLKEIGVSFHLDDFGTGYSSLARLQDFPFDALKIDRSFVMSQNWIFSEAILMLAARLQLDVIAEGIETIDQLRSLRNLGCEVMQGYYFSRPISEHRAYQLLTQNNNPV